MTPTGAPKEACCPATFVYHEYRDHYAIYLIDKMPRLQEGEMIRVDKFQPDDEQPDPQLIAGLRFLADEIEAQLQMETGAPKEACCPAVAAAQESQESQKATESSPKKTKSWHRSRSGVYVTKKPSGK